MRYPIAPNAAAAGLRDAVRLLLPARRLLNKSRIDRIAAAPEGPQLDTAMRRWGAEVLDALDARVFLTGRHHMEPSRPYLVVALHESLVDVPLLLQLALPMTFVARAELATEQPTDTLLTVGRPILISPEKPASLRVVLRDAERLSGRGRSIVMFAQGSVLGIETAFQPGARIVAEKLALPVLPVVLAGSHRIWEHPFSPLVRRGQPVWMEVLPPRPIAGAAAFRELEREMKARALANTWAPPRRYVPARDGYWDGYRFDIDPDFTAVSHDVAQHRLALAHSEGSRASRTA